MSRNTKPKEAADSSPQSEMQQRIIDQASQWLEQCDKTKRGTLLCRPAIPHAHFLNELQNEGKRFELCERGNVS